MAIHLYIFFFFNNISVFMVVAVVPVSAGFSSQADKPAQTSRPAGNSHKRDSQLGYSSGSVVLM